MPFSSTPAFSHLSIILRMTPSVTIPHALVFRVRVRAPDARQVGHRAWSFVEAGAPRRLSMWARTGSLRFPGDPSRTSALLRDPGRTGKPDHSGFPGAAPTPNTAKASARP